MLTWVLVLACFWVLFNWAAPFAVLAKALPISRGRLPGELLDWDTDGDVRFYTGPLSGGYGFSIWAPPWSIVVFDRDFFAQASPSLVRFVVAHELAHFSLGHHRKRWFAVVTGVALLPVVRGWLRRMEDEADMVAQLLTKSKRSDFPQLGGHHEE